MLNNLRSVQFGLTDLCNFKCIMCPQTDFEGLYGSIEEKGMKVHEGNTGFMELELFNRILEDCRKNNFHLGIVSLIWLGESMLHPQFREFFFNSIIFGEETGLLSSVVFNTNGSLLDEKLSEDILGFYTEHNKKIGSTITFSIDAATDETLKQIKRIDNPGEVFKNIENFLREYAKVYKKFTMPMVVLLQMIVLEENHHEAELFKKRWSEILIELGIPYDIGYSAYGECDGDNPVRIVFKRASCKNQEKMNELHTETMIKIGLIEVSEKLFDLNEQTEVEKEIVRHPCVAPFETAIINWNGDVTPCCGDTSLELNIGNVSESSFPQLINEKKINDLRIAMLKGELEKYPKCFHCGNAVLPSISIERLENLCKKSGLEEEFKLYLERIK